MILSQAPISATVLEKIQYGPMSDELSGQVSPSAQQGLAGLLRLHPRFGKAGAP